MHATRLSIPLRDVRDFLRANPTAKLVAWPHTVNCPNSVTAYVYA